MLVDDVAQWADGSAFADMVSPAAYAAEDEAESWWHRAPVLGTSPIRFAFIMPPQLVTDEVARRLAEAYRPIELTIRAAFDDYSAMLNTFAAAIGRSVNSLLGTSVNMAKLTHTIDQVNRPRWHKRRCRTCNPAGNPPPLPRTGYDYRRRLKARARHRKRRGS